MTNPSTKDVAREQAADVGRTTGEAGQRMAGTAVEQAGHVGQEARRQARDLLGQARGQVTEQARNGQQQANSGLHSLAQELHQMADGGDQQGPASELAKQAADKLNEFAEWLSQREPGDLIEEVRALARRRPGTFLLGAAAAGLLAGRLTRGAIEANRDTGDRGLTPVDTRFSAAQAGTTPMAPVGAAPAYPAPAAQPPDYRTPQPPPPGYPAGPPPERPTAGLSPGGYPATPQAEPAEFDDSAATARPYSAGAPDEPVREPGPPTPPSGTRSAGAYVEDPEARGSRGEGGPR
jgi:hypothetical protein